MKWQSTTCESMAMQPKEEIGCRAATHPSPRKHDAIPTSSRKARSRSQKEADHQARQQRAAQFRLKCSATTSLIPNLKGIGRSIVSRHRQTNSQPAAKVGFLRGALEPPHEQLLSRMAFAEQQQWITVQQKTFTKW
jgi:hypothetical protein